MTGITVQFHGLWGLILGRNKIPLEAVDLASAIRVIEAEYEAVLKEKLKDRGVALDQRLVKASVIMLNQGNVREVVNKKLSGGDVIHVFPAVMGGVISSR